MNTEYWDLFWSTGMPEAWLMSRSGEDVHRKRSEAKPGGWQKLSDSPLVCFEPRTMDPFPGGPGGLY